jgi:hypothetical protein
MTTTTPAGLASFHAWMSRAATAWPTFLARRAERLAEGRRYAGAPEKVAENIVEDLLTGVLGWALSDINHQVARCDILVTHLGVRRLLIETKRPGALVGPRAVEAAFLQARGYAETLRVGLVAVSDGARLLAADLVPGGRRTRAETDISMEGVDQNLWWLSPDGVYRNPSPLPHPAAWAPTPSEERAEPDDAPSLLHPKYRLPVTCFAYVGSVTHPSTWHLPYLDARGEIDHSRLPKAIQAVLTNYRGAHVSSIPEEAVPLVLQRLAVAARRAGRMPPECLEPAAVYVQLAQALLQFAPAGDEDPALQPS